MYTTFFFVSPEIGQRGYTFRVWHGYDSYEAVYPALMRVGQGVLRLCQNPRRRRGFPFPIDEELVWEIDGDYYLELIDLLDQLADRDQYPPLMRDLLEKQRIFSVRRALSPEHVIHCDQKQNEIRLHGEN